MLSDRQSMNCGVIIQISCQKHSWLACRYLLFYRLVFWDSIRPFYSWILVFSPEIGYDIIWHFMCTIQSETLCQHGNCCASLIYTMNNKDSRETKCPTKTCLVNENRTQLNHWISWKQKIIADYTLLYLPTSWNIIQLLHCVFPQN